MCLKHFTGDQSRIACLKLASSAWPDLFRPSCAFLVDSREPFCCWSFFACELFEYTGVALNCCRILPLLATVVSWLDCWQSLFVRVLKLHVVDEAKSIVLLRVLFSFLTQSRDLSKIIFYWLFIAISPFFLFLVRPAIDVNVPTSSWSRSFKCQSFPLYSCFQLMSSSTDHLQKLTLPSV
jgi:hypothetical protein